MRELIKEFAAIAAETLPIGEPIYEFGSLQVPEQVGFADLRPIFPGREYVGADMRSGPGVDRVLDLHSLDLPDASVGTALAFDTLEHVEFPHRALEEIHRVLRPDGVAMISSVMNFPIHNFPSDYWRFTPEGFRSLLGPFGEVWVTGVGDPAFPHTVMGLGLPGGFTFSGEFHVAVVEWHRKWSEMELEWVNPPPPRLLRWLRRG
jgi:SAM-dependent methyltransferase